MSISVEILVIVSVSICTTLAQEAKDVNLISTLEPSTPFFTEESLSTIRSENSTENSVSFVENAESIITSTTTGNEWTSTTENYNDVTATCRQVQEPACPPVECNMDGYTQETFLSKYLHSCRYDKLSMPTVDEPLDVYVQVDINHIEAEEQFKFKLHMVITFRFEDNRLNYRQVSPNRGSITGEEALKAKIWTPHIFVTNEQSSSIMGFGGKDVFLSINPDGTVVFSERLELSIYCFMDLKKFPFDEQVCSIYFKTWTYNASKLLLRWEETDPVAVAPYLHLTEFKFVGHTAYEAITNSTITHGTFHTGNHSTLVVEFLIAREIGYYIMDYFIPSVLLVMTSWVSFWLQADASPARTALGTSTMLAFITLATGQSKNLPKVSYIKASEIWFLGCVVFIFLSMAEFAFVNVIWRRKKKVELKKMKGKYILKSALSPRLARKELQKEWNSLNNLHKSRSCSSLESDSSEKRGQCMQDTYNTYLTVHSFPNITIPENVGQSNVTLVPGDSQDSISIPVPNRNGETPQPPTPTWASMTPQEVAIWIDKKSRFVFPCAFFIFNILYWSFVYVL